VLFTQRINGTTTSPGLTTSFCITTSFCLYYRKVQASIARKKAAVAVAHKILAIVYHLFSEDAIYDDGRYNRLSRKQEDHRLNMAQSTLKNLGYQVQLTPVA